MIARARNWLPDAGPFAAGAFLALQAADRTVPLAWAVLTIGGAVSLLADRIDWHKPASPVERALLALIGACLLSAVCGVDRARSLLLSVPMLGAVLLWLLTARAPRQGAAILAVRSGLAIAAAGQTLLLLIAAVRAPQVAPAEWTLSAGAAWLIVPNDFAWIGCALPLFAAPARRPRTVLCVLLAACLAVCALLHSRTAALAALASALAFLAFSGATWRSRKAISLAALAVSACAVVGAGVASMRAREQLWGAAWSIFRDHPLLGVGIHNFVLVYRSYLPPDYEWIDGRLTPWPHDLPLEIAAECGIVGIIAAAFVCVALARWTFSQRAARESSAAAVCAALMGLSLLALVEASLLRQWLWFFGASMCALTGLQAGARASPKGNEAHAVEQDSAQRHRGAAVDR
jgi:O-antigen ligase